MNPSDFTKAQGKCSIIIFSELNSPFGSSFLCELFNHRRVEVSALVTRPDSHLCPDYDHSEESINLKVQAQRYGIPVMQPVNVNDLDSELRQYDADFFLIANYQQILDNHIFTMPRRFSINFHPIADRATIRTTSLSPVVPGWSADHFSGPPANCDGC